jgi:methionine sulfoxide reductase heme-binding subunit
MPLDSSFIVHPLSLKIMSVNYEPIHWTPHKRLYDKIMLGVVAAYLVVFIGAQLLLFPEITVETIIIRATGTLAFLMLHFILIIGPLCRLDTRFLPLLYNRRHLGVTMFLISTVHGIFSLIQFHGLGNVGILTSLFTSNIAYGSVERFPFQSLGAGALLILFLMAATSHDFWLKNLTPRVWKTLHMFVYLAYGLLILHVMLGTIQLEKSPVLIGLVGVGLCTIAGFHVAAGFKQRKKDNAAQIAPPQYFSDFGSQISDIDQQAETMNMKFDMEFVYACEIADIPNNRAKMLIIGGENIAIFKYDNSKISAVHNLCKHQNGPLGEGKIIDGCITCPWHGYQYRPQDGQSPPPFTEKLATYDVKIIGSKVYVNPKPYPEGTLRPAAEIEYAINA